MNLRLPLYGGIDLDPFKIPKGESPHIGLLYDHFFNCFDADWSIPKVVKNHEGKECNPRQEWLNQFKKVFCSCGDENQLGQVSQRRIQLVSSLGGEFGIFKLDWHFVTGLGNEHPVENGFSWHPTLGTPWIPGATVKGLVRAWVERELIPAGQCDKELVYQLFGSESKDPAECQQDNRAGALTFFDAIPTGKVQLLTDIMTPHCGKWYEKGGTDEVMQADSLPGDWHSPVPVPFLVCKESSFLFGIAPREGGTVAVEQLHQAMAWLEEALIFWGVGAKTATGYGHMDRDETAENRLKSGLQEQAAIKAEQARLATMASEEVAMDVLRQRMDKGEDKGCGPGSSLGAALGKLFNQAMSETWDVRHYQALLVLGKELYRHLGVDLKNKKVKERLRELEARCR